MARSPSPRVRRGGVQGSLPRFAGQQRQRWRAGPAGSARQSRRSEQRHRCRPRRHQRQQQHRRHARYAPGRSRHGNTAAENQRAARRVAEVGGRVKRKGAKLGGRREGRGTTTHETQQTGLETFLIRRRHLNTRFVGGAFQPRVPHRPSTARASPPSRMSHGTTRMDRVGSRRNTGFPALVLYQRKTAATKSRHAA